MNIQATNAIIKERKDSLGGILSVLGGIQSKYGYLPEEALRRVADATGRSLTDIYAVATFYRAFSLKPRGKHIISVCLGTACHVRGAPKIVEEFSAQLRVKPGETTPDKEFTLETVNCLGACALGPTVAVDGHYFRHVTVADVRHIIRQAVTGRKRPGSGDPRVFPLSAQCPKCRESLMNSKNIIDGLPSIKLSVDTGTGKKNVVYRSSLYGSDAVRCESDIADGVPTSLACPQCGKNLSADADCPECGGKMAMMYVEGGAKLYVCPRGGCPGHRLDLVAQKLRPKQKQEQKPERRPRRKVKESKSRTKPKSKQPPKPKSGKKKRA